MTTLKHRALQLLLPISLACSCTSPQQPQYAHRSSQTTQTLPAAPVSLPPITPAQFTIGSTKSEVATVMGTPTQLHNFGSAEIWSYGLSSITFRDGAVSEWDNFGNLRVVYPGAAPAFAPPTRNQTRVLYTQPAVAGNASFHSQITQLNASPATTLNTGPGVAENGSYFGQPNKVGIPKTVPVRGYWRKDGTYVRGHYRSRPTGRTKKLTW